MVTISICGLCKNYKGKEKCMAFPEGIDFDFVPDPYGEECGSGFFFEPAEDCKELCSNPKVLEAFRRNKEDKGTVEV
jgi:hypothetical protein